MEEALRVNAGKRPRYESPEDLAAELAVANAFALAFGGLRPLKLSDEDRLDFMLLDADGFVRAVMEIKCRKGNFIYPDFMVSASKHRAGCQMARAYQKPFYLVAKWDDGIYWTNAGRAVVARTEEGGRDDRDDRFDREQCVYIPKSEFERL